MVKLNDLSRFQEIQVNNVFLFQKTLNVFFDGNITCDHFMGCHFVSCSLYWWQWGLRNCHIQHFFFQPVMTEMIFNGLSVLVRCLESADKLIAVLFTLYTDRGAELPRIGFVIHITVTTAEMHYPPPNCVYILFGV